MDQLAQLIAEAEAAARANATQLAAEKYAAARALAPDDVKLLDEALAVASRIADLSIPIAMMVKESVNRAFETALAEGVRFERRLFHSTFATEDQKEGMAAFIEKRKPVFTNK